MSIEVWRQAQEIKKHKAIRLPVLADWNYGPCSHHKTPQRDCEYQQCGGNLDAHQTVSAVFHYAAKKSMNASSPGTGKTNSMLATLCLIKHYGLPLKAVVIVPTSAVKQWAAETQRFAPGLKTIAVTSGLTKPERQRVYASNWEVLIIGYHLLTRDVLSLEALKPKQVISDDVDPLTRHTNKTHKAIASLALHADRTIVANATNIQTQITQLHAAAIPVTGPDGKDLWGKQHKFETMFIQKVPVYIETTRLNQKKQKVKVTQKVMQAKGVKNMEVLSALYDLICIRYSYEDLEDSADIPSVVSETVWVDLHPEQRRKYEQLQQGLLELKKKEFDSPQQRLVASLAKFSQPLGSHILVPGGWKCMGDMKVGDEVLSPDGSVCHVTGVSDVQKRKVYRVTLSDGSTCEASDTHLWNVSYTNHRNKSGRTQVLRTTQQLAEEKLTIGTTGKNELKYRLPDISLRTPDIDLPIPPYALGAFLGDGCIRKSSVSLGVKVKDREIIDEVSRLLGPDYSFSITDHSDADYLRGLFTYTNKDFSYCRSCGATDYHARSLCASCYWKHRWAGTLENYPTVNTNPLTNSLYELGMNHPGWNKSIPDVYKYAGHAQRLDLLRGLMDTDGYSKKKGSLSQFTTTSPRLAEDVADLARSLGGTARTRRFETPNRPKYSVYLTCPLNPFLLERKSSQWTPPKRRTRNIRSVEEVEEKDVRCIMLDSEDHLYVTDNYIPTHNTYGAQICAGLPALGEEDGEGASSKLDWFMEKITGVWADEKAILYAKNVGTIEALHARLDKAGVGYATVWGKEPDAQVRADEQKRFREDPDCQVMIISAAGERSLNLQYARILVMLDSQYNPARVRQIVGRARRVGSKFKRVYVFMLYATDTQEERISKVLAARQAIADAAAGEEGDELFEHLTADELLRLIAP